jgi:hypothetical protein
MRVLAFVCVAAVLLLSARASAESLGSIRVTSENNGICDDTVVQQSGEYMYMYMCAYVVCACV